MNARRKQIFVSYSHADKEALMRLRIHLKPYERNAQLDVWSDEKIRAGADWRSEISKAIDRSAAAILLISADFLASDFIAENELPPLLNRAEKEGVKIIPVILKPSAFVNMSEISRFQAINDPNNPLIEQSEADKERVWCNVAKSAHDAIKNLSGNDAYEHEIHDYCYAEDNVLVVKNNLEYLIDDELAMIYEQINNPEAVRKYHVYQYHHIDSLEYMLDAEDVLKRLKNKEIIINEIKEKLKQSGWEGDGKLQLLWLPPFVGAGVEDTFGVCIWHIKQRNNGTSWLASPVPLPFSRLLEQQY